MKKHEEGAQKEASNILEEGKMTQEKLDALICPGQFVSPSKIDFMLCSQTESLTPRRTCSVPACSFTKLTVRRYIS